MLREHGFAVFLDEDKLRTGDLWADHIFEEVHKADVLIVLLQEATADSDWIQREVDMARSLFLPILPLLVDDMPEENLRDAKNRLNLHSIQHTYFKAGENEFSTLIQDIYTNVEKTKVQQIRLFGQFRGEANRAHQDRIRVERQNRLGGVDDPITNLDTVRY